ncbi:MAG: hypothetical protein ACI9FG_001018, partial [Crocinitomicaceae bacterium]
RWFRIIEVEDCQGGDSRLFLHGFGKGNATVGDRVKGSTGVVGFLMLTTQNHDQLISGARWWRLSPFWKKLPFVDAVIL